MFARSDNKGADCGFRIAQEVVTVDYYYPNFELDLRFF